MASWIAWAYNCHKHNNQFAWESLYLGLHTQLLQFSNKVMSAMTFLRKHLSHMYILLAWKEEEGVVHIFSGKLQNNL